VTCRFISVMNLFKKAWQCTREGERDVIAVWIIGLYHVNHSVERSVFADKYVFYDDLEMTLRRI